MELQELYTRYVIPNSKKYLETKDFKSLFKFFSNINKYVKFNPSQVKKYNKDIYYAYQNAKNITMQLFTRIKKKEDEFNNLKDKDKINFITKILRQELLKSITDKIAINTINKTLTLLLVPIAVMIIVALSLKLIINVISMIVVASITILIYIILSPNINYIISLYKKNKTIQKTLKEYYDNVINIDQDDIADVRILKLSIHIVLLIMAILSIIILLTVKSFTIIYLMSLIGGAIILYLSSISILIQQPGSI